MNITDSSGIPLAYLSLQQNESTDSQTIQILVPCIAGRVLKEMTGNADARALARRTGSGSPFVDLNTSPIALDAWDGTTQPFDIKFHSNAVAVQEIASLEIKVVFA